MQAVEPYDRKIRELTIQEAKASIVEAKIQKQEKEKSLAEDLGTAEKQRLEIAKKLAIRDFENQEMIHQDVPILNCVRGCGKKFCDMQKDSLISIDKSF
jgi:predicted component of type VI protein secretion system